MKYYREIVFLYSEEADEAMQILNKHGEKALLAHLEQWDCGEGIGRVKPPWGESDRFYKARGYVVNWNPSVPYCGLVKIEKE